MERSLMLLSQLRSLLRHADMGTVIERATAPEVRIACWRSQGVHDLALTRTAAKIPMAAETTKLREKALWLSRDVHAQQCDNSSGSSHDYAL
jgi:hypothetical protein